MVKVVKGMVKGMAKAMHGWLGRHLVLAKGRQHTQSMGSSHRLQRWRQRLQEGASLPQQGLTMTRSQMGQALTLTLTLSLTTSQMGLRWM